MSEQQNMTVGEKIQALKKMHLHSHPSAKRQIEEWENELVRLEMDAAWLKHPNTKQFADQVRGQLANIDQVLLTDEAIAESDRKLYFKLKNILLTLLAVLSEDPASEIQQIDNSVSTEL